MGLGSICTRIDCAIGRRALTARPNATKLERIVHRVSSLRPGSVPSPWLNYFGGGGPEKVRKRHRSSPKMTHFDKAFRGTSSRGRDSPVGAAAVPTFL